MPKKKVLLGHERLSQMSQTSRRDSLNATQLPNECNTDYENSIQKLSLVAVDEDSELGAMQSPIELGQL